MDGETEQARTVALAKRTVDAVLVFADVLRLLDPLTPNDRARVIRAAMIFYEVPAARKP